MARKERKLNNPIDIRVIKANAEARGSKEDIDKQVRFSCSLNERLYKSGITQAEFCKRTGIGSGTISNYRSGISAPSILALQTMADVLDIHPYKLMTGRDPEKGL